jgi:hypothetical protein
MNNGLDHPRIIEYLQRGQQQQQQEVEQPMQQEQPEYNPFDKGIMKAIAQARESMGLTGHQRGRAMAVGIAKFNEGLDKTGPARGFWGNVGRFSDAFAPAYGAHGQQEQDFQQDNLDLAELVQKLQEQELKKKGLAEKESWNRKFKLATLGRQQEKDAANRDYQERSLNYKMSKGEGEEGNTDTPLIRTDSAFDKVAAKREKSAKFFTEVSEIMEANEKLKAAMIDAGLDPMNPLAFNQTMMKVKNLTSAASKDPKMRNIIKIYKDLDSRQRQAAMTAEKANKDGALTDFTVKYAEDKGLFPSFSDLPDVRDEKLRTMYENAKSGYGSAAMSTKTRRYIDAVNYTKNKDRYEQELGLSSLKAEAEVEQSSQASGEIPMTDPSGNPVWVRQEQVQDALNEGYTNAD